MSCRPTLDRVDTVNQRLARRPGRAVRHHHWWPRPPTGSSQTLAEQQPRVDPRATCSRWPDPCSSGTRSATPACRHRPAALARGLRRDVADGHAAGRGRGRHASPRSADELARRPVAVQDHRDQRLLVLLRPPSRLRARAWRRARRSPPGTLIGFVGNTGDAAGGPTHLHFEIHHPDGKVLDSFGLLKTAWPARQEQLHWAAPTRSTRRDPADRPRSRHARRLPPAPDGSPVERACADAQADPPDAVGRRGSRAGRCSSGAAAGPGRPD